MTTPAELHAVERVARALAHDITHQARQRAARAHEGVPAEREEQWQIDLDGTATSTLSTVQVDLDFQHAFITAIGRRMSQLDRPQLHTGFELTSSRDMTNGRPSAAVPIMHAAVVRWKLDSAMNIIGARLAISAYSPDHTLKFRGVAHATFQGYGIVRDHQPDEDA